MLTTVLPNNYKILYLVPTSYLICIIVANTIYKSDLQTDEESHRKLLTVTATFTYKKQLRWIWYYISLTCCVLYAGISPPYFKAYFKSSQYLDNLRLKHDHHVKEGRFLAALRLLTSTSIIWSMSLSVVIFMIQGKYPATDAEIEAWIWSTHYLALLSLLVSHALYMFSFLFLIGQGNRSIRVRHQILIKSVICGCYCFSVLAMIFCVAIGNTVQQHNLDKFWDATCFFEYTTVLAIMIWNIELWSGFTYDKNGSYYRLMMVSVSGPKGDLSVVEPDEPVTYTSSTEVLSRKISSCRSLASIVVTAPKRPLNKMLSRTTSEPFRGTALTKKLSSSIIGAMKPSNNRVLYQRVSESETLSLDGSLVSE